METENKTYELQLTVNNGNIVSNLNELGLALERDYGKYAKLVVPVDTMTPETYKELSKVRAELNKLHKAIDDERKGCVANIQSIVKTAKSMVDDKINILLLGSDNLKGILDNYTTKENSIAYLEAEKIYDTVKNSIEFINLDTSFEMFKCDDLVLSSKLKGKPTKIKEYFKNKLNSVLNDINTIDKLDGTYEKEYIKAIYYKQGCNLQLAMQFYLDEKALRDEINSKVGTSNGTVSHDELQATAETSVETQENELLERSFTVTCTKQQLIDLSNFMNQNNIKFKKL